MESKDKGVIINAAWGAWYPDGSKRLERSLIHHGWNYQTKFWRNEPINAFFNPQYPYTIKAAAVQQAIWDGYTHIIWMDCALWVTDNPNILMDKVDSQGGLFIHSGYNLAQTASDSDLKFAKMSRDRAEILPELWSCIFGFNLNTEKGKKFAEVFIEASKNGVFNTPREHNGKSKDPRFLHARQDQTAATIAYYKAGFDIAKNPDWLLSDYTKDETKLIYRRGM